MKRMNTKEQRTVQDVFDDERENKKNIKDTKDEIECSEQELKEYIEKGKVIKNELESLMIDLIKQKKIEFIKCDMNTWLKYGEEKREEEYYIYYYEGELRNQGYFKGVSLLDEDDMSHFKKFINDYFYYGYPLYIDRNHENSEMTECELAFECGSALLKKARFD